MKGEYCLSTSGVGSPPHSLPSTSGAQNDKIEDVHCACISKLETQVEEQVNGTRGKLKKHSCSLVKRKKCQLSNRSSKVKQS